MTVEEIKKAIAGSDYEFYGIRVDDGIRYNVGDIANNSHQLFRDPFYGDDDNLVYPYIEDGIYSGFYDAGELPGTCTIGFDPDDDESIARAIDAMMYYGDYIHVLGGDCAEGGNDMGELIIADATVLCAVEK